MKRDRQPTSYDKVPYHSHPFSQTHPDRLATIGQLFGLNPPAVTSSCILELGCASGGNLIPMACQLPNSDFIGVDLSKRQVKRGNRIIEKLYLKNIQIKNISIMDIDSSWGHFDYIIAHGIFSWVSAKVREKLISICSENLSPKGIAYISYNTYPGWHMREMIRHMMLFHSNQFEDTSERIGQARALMDFLSGSVPTENNHYGLLLKSELELIRQSKDWYLFHDHLEEENTPVYFHQFMKMAEKYDLQYLGEAEFSTMLASGFPKEVEETLNKISPDIIRTEQYMDFVRNRQFRQTLLCHKEIPLKRDLGPDDVNPFLVASSARPEFDLEDLSLEEKQSFKTANDLSIETKSPITKTALKILYDAWPKAIHMNLLYEKVKQRLKGVSFYHEEVNDNKRRIFYQDLLHCFAANVIELHTWQADFIIDVKERPTISVLAKYMANQGEWVVNQRHETVNLDPVARQLVLLSDGDRDQRELLSLLVKLAQNGTLVVKQDENRLTESDQLRPILENAIKQAWSRLGKCALIMK